MFCRNCAQELPDHAVACMTCGAPTGVPSPYGAPQQQQFQQQQFQQQAQPMKSDKSRVAYILLGLFIGTLGIHNFYAGYNGRGIAQLLVTLLLGWWTGLIFFVWIWNLVEIIAVSKDAQGLQMS